jgi:hypothetical protein
MAYDRVAIGVLGVVVPTALSLTWPEAPTLLLAGLWAIAAIALIVALWHPLRRYVNRYVLLREPSREQAGSERGRGGSSRANHESVIARSEDERYLTVEIRDEDWDVYRHMAYIVGINVRVTNNTGKRKRLMGVAMGIPGSDSYGLHLHDKELRREVYRQSEERGQYGQHMPSMLAPRDSADFWHVVALPRPTKGGHGGYELGVTDELNHDYVAVRLPEKGQTHVWGSAIAKESGAARRQT